MRRPANLPYSLPAPVAAQRSPGLSKIYVANSGEDSGAAASVLVFARRADGDVAPERTIAGSNTGMINPDGIAVDAAGRIYVADPFAATSGAVLIFGPNADGNAAPSATPLVRYVPSVIVAIGAAFPSAFGPKMSTAPDVAANGSAT